MKYKNIYVLLLIVAGSSVYAAEQSMQQEQMPRELVVEIFVRNLPKYTTQEALDALKALRETNKSFATDQGLQKAIDFMKNYNKSILFQKYDFLDQDDIAFIAALLRAQEWLRNHTESVDSLIVRIIGQELNTRKNLPPFMSMLETVWPFSSKKFNFDKLLPFGLYPIKDIQAACEIAKFLHEKNIPINNEKTGYSEVLQLMITNVQYENKLKELPIYTPDPKIIEGYKILYKCLKDLGARLDPKYQEEAKELGLE